MSFRVEQFDYQLPPDLIAQVPAQPRDTSRLLVLDRNSGEIKHQHFYDLPTFLQAGDVLVRNNTKVIPARIFGHKVTGGRVELLLTQQISHDQISCQWECLSKPGLKENQTVTFPDSGLVGRCVKLTGYTRIIEFNLNLQSFYIELNRIGLTPIPPYIHWASDDEQQLRQLYQTTYAKISGSAAAPTAGLHFTPAVDAALHAKGVEILEVTLHVGLGTFLPLQPEQIAAGKLHHELYEVTAETAAKLTAAKQASRRIIAVGTTSTRVLETLTYQNQVIKPGVGETDLFIQPGRQFQVVDAMITNFHLPKSSLLLLVSAFTTEPNGPHQFQDFLSTPVGIAYTAAIQEKYHFFSFGDAMFIH